MKRVCEFCGETYHNRGWHLENRCSFGPDPKSKRIFDPGAKPLDSSPIDNGRCPLCDSITFIWERAHIVGKGVGGDDLPGNLAWLCCICHGSLHRDGQDSDVARRFVRYCRETVPELGAYADAKKYQGYIERRYLGA